MNKILNTKTITIYTIIIYLIGIFIFEFGYCNSNFLYNIIIGQLDFEYHCFPIRILCYVAGIILICIFKNNFIKNSIETCKNKYKRIFIYVSLIITFIIFIAYVIIIFVNPLICRGMTIGLLSVFATDIFIIYVSNNVTKNVIVTIATFGIIFAISTDYNHAIDEKRHFMTAFNIANYNFDYSNNPITDKKLDKLPHFTKFTSIDAFLEEKYIPEITNEVNIQDIPSTPATYPFISYIFAAFGIFLAKNVGGSIIDMYILGRIFNLLFYGLLVTNAVKILPFKKNIFAIIFCMPLALLLSASYSIDGFCIGVVALFIAYCMKLYYNNKEITLKQFLILMSLFLLMLTAKSMSYIFVAIIVLILPLKKTLKKNKKYIPIMIAILLLSIIALLITVVYIKNTQLVADTRGGNTNTSEQISILLNNPVHDLKLVLNQIKTTIFNFEWWSDLYISEFFTLDSIYIFFAMLLFVLYVSITEDDYNFTIKEKIILVISFLFVFGMTSLALYISFTEVGENYIAGYQTRYVIPILPILLFTISSTKLKKKINLNRSMNVSIGNGVFLLVSLMLAILA